MLRTCFSIVPSVDPQRTGDTGIRAALCHQRQHFALTLRECGKRVVMSTRREQLLYQRGIDHRCPVADPLNGVDEIGYIADPALEQITDAFTAG